MLSQGCVRVVLMYLQIATWLDAVLYLSDFRPVPLREHLKDGRLILDRNNQVCADHPSSGCQDPVHHAMS
jgi:hypothetical protein